MTGALDPLHGGAANAAMLLFKIFRPAEWAELDRAGTTAGAPIDQADGFIHFSTAEQARDTAAKHFADAGDLVLAACDSDALAEALRWEVSRGGALFPHLYADLPLAAVIAHAPVAWNEDGSLALPG